MLTFPGASSGTNQQLSEAVDWWDSRIVLCMSKRVSVCARGRGGLPWLLEGEAMLAVGRPRRMVRVWGRAFASLPCKLSADATLSTWLVLGRGRARAHRAGHAGSGDLSGGGKVALCRCPRFPGKAEPLRVFLKCCQIPAYSQMWYFVGLLEDLISRCQGV